jgi:hypothetical protein
LLLPPLVSLHVRWVTYMVISFQITRIAKLGLAHRKKGKE